MALALSLVERELELGAPPLPQLLERAAGCSQGPAKTLMEACLAGLEHLEREDFSTLWNRQVRQLPQLGRRDRLCCCPWARCWAVTAVGSSGRAWRQYAGAWRSWPPLGGGAPPPGAGLPGPGPVRRGLSDHFAPLTGGQCLGK